MYYVNEIRLGENSGEFAQYLNYFFSDRKCYLFGTFDGFDAKGTLVITK